MSVADCQPLGEVRGEPHGEEMVSAPASALAEQYSDARALIAAQRSGTPWKASDLGDGRGGAVGSAGCSHEGYETACV